MKQRFLLLSRGALFCALLAVQGCETDASQDDPVTLGQAPAEGAGGAVWLEAKAGSETTTIQVMYKPEPGHGARVAEHFLRLSENLRVEESRAAESVRELGKEFVVQDDSAHRLRVVLYSLESLETMPAGALYELTLRKIGRGEASVAFDNLDQPMFAPSEASESLRVGGELKF